MDTIGVTFFFAFSWPCLWLSPFSSLVLFPTGFLCCPGFVCLSLPSLFSVPRMGHDVLSGNLRSKNVKKIGCGMDTIGVTFFFGRFLALLLAVSFFFLCVVFSWFPLFAWLCLPLSACVCLCLLPKLIPLEGQGEGGSGTQEHCQKLIL